MSEAPSTNGSNGGRDTSGRFRSGNPGGPGNPYAAKVARIRVAFLESVSEDDIRDIVAKMVEEAKGGDLASAREILQRTIGNADPLDLAESHLLHRHARALGEDCAEDKVLDKELADAAENLIKRVRDGVAGDEKNG